MKKIFLMLLLLAISANVQYSKAGNEKSGQENLSYVTDDQTPEWLWPVEGKAAGNDILYRPQDYINGELNFSSLFIATEERLCQNAGTTSSRDGTSDMLLSGLLHEKVPPAPSQSGGPNGRFGVKCKKQGLNGCFLTASTHKSRFIYNFAKQCQSQEVAILRRASPKP